jgi:tetratricopeptide (TPR) repeat protein
MSIESLKQQARRHEQDEEWLKALEQYKKAISALDQDDQTDIGLINRVGDLYVRVGKLDDAVKHYERAVDLYREAFLPNNAIAVCKKVIRNVPERHQAYLKIGQIRAEQGFLSDARTNFLTYAERMQKAGDLDESFRALVEFCDLAPDDVDVRVTVAEQMAASHRNEDAVEQLLVAYRQVNMTGDTGKAGAIEAKVKVLDPNVDLGAALTAAGSGFGGGGDDQFGDIMLGEPAQPEVEAAVESDSDFGGFEISGRGTDAVTESLEEASEEEGVELPMMGFGDDSEEDEEEEEGVELPMMGFGDDSEEEDEEEGVELPTMGFGDDSEEEEAAELPMMGFGDDSDEEEDSTPLPTMSFESEAVEEAIEESAPELTPVVERAAPPPPPPPLPPPPPPAQPAAPAQDYVDLGAMIFGGMGDKPKSTRFKVAYEEPSGDEEADFAKMLSQFKEKVSENLDSGDVRAHYDLGTAYKEMGLLEEAIGSFQQALRASAEHLPTYEIMGQTFIEMGQPEAAVKTLQRALQAKASVEDEFVGIYYYLARAFESLGRNDSAVEYYDRVFALDINFADVTERLRALR